VKPKRISILSRYDQNELFGDLWQDDKQNKALVAVFHGMAEHRFRYYWFAEKLNKAGYTVLLCDQRGHGESGPMRGYFAKENGWLVNDADLADLIGKAKAMLPEQPLFLFGHSMGSMSARTYLKHHEAEVEKVVLSGTPSYSSAVGMAKVIARMQSMFQGEKHYSKLIDKLGFGSLNAIIKDPRTPFDWLSQNQENVDAYIADKDCGFIFTVSGYHSFLEGMQDVFLPGGWKVEKPDLPIAFFSGAEDPCSKPKEGFEKAVRFLKEQGYTRVSSKRYAGLRHEILNEKERDVVVKDIIHYLDNDKIS
jgi:alpha-beta hydrolase superfamily lysophospholipase